MNTATPPSQPTQTTRTPRTGPAPKPQGVRALIPEPLEGRALFSASAWNTELDYQFRPGASTAINALTGDASAVYAAGYGNDAANVTHGIVIKKSYAGGSWSTTPVEDFQLVAGKAAQFNDAGFDAAGNLYTVGRGNDTDGLGSWVVTKSTDGGASWAVVDKFRYASGKSSEAKGFASDASGGIYVIGNGIDNVTYKGTTGFQHELVRKSTDGGKTWVTIDDFQPEAGKWAYGYDIAVSGTSVYAVGASGNNWTVRKGSSSSKSPTDWQTIDSFNLYSGDPTIARSVVVDPSGSVYVAGDGLAGSTTAQDDHWLVRKLAAGSATFTTVDNYQLQPGVMYGAAAYTLGLDAAGNVFVAGKAQATDGGHAVTRTSSNGGATWTTVDNYLLSAGKTSRNNSFFADRQGNLLTAGNGQDASGTTHGIVRSAAAFRATMSTPASDPAYNAVDRVTTTFTRAAAGGFDLSDLTLDFAAADGSRSSTNLSAYSSALTLTTADGGVTWLLDGLARSGLTTQPGTYTLTLKAAGSGITDAFGFALSADASAAWVQ